jgi:2-phosphoglycolate phosphatase
MLAPAAVVFDMDGTLVDSRQDIVAAVNHALTRTGREALASQIVTQYIGDGARWLCARSAQVTDDSPEVDRLVELFKEHYLQHPIDFTCLMPGAGEAIARLSQMPDMALGICTNKHRATTEAILSALGLRDHFRAIAAGSDLPEQKPAPGPLLFVAKALRVPAEAIVMVGDMYHDVECARRAGARSVGVAGGYGPRERLLEARPDILLESLSELPAVVQAWREQTHAPSSATGFVS